MKTRTAVSAIVALALMSSACATRRYGKPIGGFQSASAVVIASTRQWLETANKLERDHYVDAQRAAGDVIEPKQLEEMSRTFAAPDIAARMQALRTLGEYGALLARLAATEGPQEASGAVKELGEAVKSLGTTATKLCTGPGCADGNARFQQAAGVVAKVVGRILEGWLSRKAGVALDETIVEAEQPVSELIGAIRQDIQNLAERRRQAASEQWSAAIREFNAEAKDQPASKERLRGLAERVKTQADLRERLASDAPTAALDAMDKAHRALVTYARSKKTPQTFSEVVDAIDAFATAAGQAARAALPVLQGL
jgi:hypothetical protein